MDKYQQAQHDWYECMWRIGRAETRSFEEDNVKYTETLMWSRLRRGIMIWVYNDLCNTKKLARIESLPIEDKMKAWEFVLDICRGKEIEKKVKVEILKIFYVIEYFINEPKKTPGNIQ